MPFLVRPPNARPAPPLRINPNSPLAQGIVWCVPFLAGYGPPIDIVENPVRVAGGNATWDVNGTYTSAYSWNFTNASTADLAFTSGPFTVASVCNFVLVSGLGSPAVITRSLYTSESVNTGWKLGLNNAGHPTFICFANNASGNYDVISGAVATLGNHVIAGSTNGTNRKTVWWDGEQALASTTGSFAPLASTGTLVDYVAAPAQHMYMGVIWNRELSQYEQQQFYTNPWQILWTGQPNATAWVRVLSFIPRPMRSRVLLTR